MDPKDLRVESYGDTPYETGMGVHRTPVAVKVTHIPTRISVVSESERSMYANRVEAMRLLEEILHGNDTRDC